MRPVEWIRPEIQALSAYHVPDAHGLIKLDAMENPYTWPASLRDAWLQLLSGVSVNRYPDPRGGALKQRLREAMSIPDSAGIILGNGSDELIQMLAMVVARPHQTLLSVEPGFAMYRMIATFTGMGYLGVHLNPSDFSLDTPALLQAIAEHRPALVFLAYPNNPTGNLFSAEALHRIVQAAPGLVVIDEAYAPFTDASFMGQLGRYENLLIMRTLSKMGFAGLRLGILVGPQAWLLEIDKVRLPYNINTLTQVSADFALTNRRVFDEQTQAIRLARTELFKQLSCFKQLEVYPSEANFLLVRCPSGRGGGIHSALKEAGILVKNLDAAHPLLRDCLRVTVGTEEENRAFLAALTEILS